MNQGGEPGHDDYGLPRVDIEIPDDARELDRDVQAYHRELRALRRHARSRRWRAPLGRSGVLLPVIAGCLVLAMLAGMVLTMFSSSSYFSGLAGPQRSVPAAGGGSQGNVRSAPPTGRATSPVPRTPTSTAPGATAPGSTAPGSTAPGSTAPGTTAPGPQPSTRLPGKTISVAGKPVALSTLTSTALAIVPAHCGCQAAVRQLLAEARAAGVIVYLVGARAVQAELTKLAGGSAGGRTLVATDAGNVLTAAYQPSGLTVLLVNSRGVVAVMSRLHSGLRLEPEFQSLRPAS